MVGAKGSGGARKGAGRPLSPARKAISLAPGDQWITGDGGGLKLLTVVSVSSKEIIFRVEIGQGDERRTVEPLVMIR